MFDNVFYFTCGGIIGVFMAKAFSTLSFSLPNLVLYATIAALPFVLKSLNAKKK